jgi:hypothetical protein
LDGGAGAFALEVGAAVSSVTQLSRAEVMTLLYDKVTQIREEAEQIEDEPKPAKLGEYKARLKRIVIEAKRAASLIETHERTWKEGHCLYCGETYEAHMEVHPPLLPGEPRVKGKRPGAPARAVQCPAPIFRIGGD